MEREIAKYSYVMMLALVISSIFNYLYQVVMGILLPKGEFGILGVSLSAFYITSVLTQNTFSWSGTRRMSAFPEKTQEIFGTTFFGNLLLAVIASTFILLYARKSETYALPSILVVVAILFSALANSCVSLLRAKKKFSVIAGANVANAVLKFLLAILFVLLGFGAIGAIGSLAASVVVASVFLIYYALKSSKLMIPRNFSEGFLIETFYVSVVFLGVAFLLNSSVIFARILSGSDILAGDFNAALTIARGGFFITTSLVTVLFPYVSSRNSKSEEYAFQSVKYLVLFIFPLCISMATDPETWLSLFFGGKYSSGSEILRILSVGVGLISLTYMTSSNLVAFESYRFPALVLIIALIVQMFTMFVVGAPPEITASASVVAGSAISAVLLLAYYIRRFYFKASLEHVLKIVMSYLILSLAFLLIQVDSRIYSLCEVIFSFSVYVFTLSLLGLFDEKDVEILLSPLPASLVESVKKIVSKLNTLSR